MPKLSKSAVDALPIPAKGQKLHWCSSLSGFGVRVTATGAKSYVVQGRIKGTGKERRYTIGPCHLLDYAEARKRALDRLSEMHDGKDPQAEKRKRRVQSITLRDVMEDYIENKRTKNGRLRPSSKADIKKCVAKYLADWAEKPVADITRDACIKRFRKLSEAGPVQANQVFRNLRALLNWARETNMAPDGSYPILPINPVTQAFNSKGITWSKEEAREEIVPLDKMGEVWQLLTTRTDTERFTPSDACAAHLVMFLILTGARIGEGSKLRWEHVNLDDEVPSFTFAETKNHNVVTVPMSQQLHSLLSVRYAARRGNQEYVFPSRAGAKVGHMQDARGTMRMVSEVAGLHLHHHDLRRTFIAIGDECNIQRWRVKLLANHKDDHDVTMKHYTRKKDLRYMLPEAQTIADWITKQSLAHEMQGEIDKWDSVINEFGDDLKLD
ncbi:integrase family protein [Halomonas sp. ANAO-440]|uniref:tyrosine-type recombinase/integrase n=1 Tax=Halomonas sp. ANAO-440 TaxID=2861360 RepID=UPI001CAA8187|nr:integrase family protein [Halomonas sp. ANAO-440]MBZ0330030.1 integrase family protein [Halomonas sp. ANAO-440]